LSFKPSASSKNTCLLVKRNPSSQFGQFEKIGILIVTKTIGGIVIRRSQESSMCISLEDHMDNPFALVLGKPMPLH
jgi:hypothetical protein